MSEASPGATWQRPKLVGAFLSERATLMPLLDVQQDIVRRLFERHGRALGRFLDVGSGDGAMSELMLGVDPGAEAVLVDFSEPMLERVERRLAGGGRRWRTVRADLSDPSWRLGLPEGRFGGAVSGFAIHHLPAARKRSLFAEIFELLEPGALFVNMDHVAVQGPLQGLWDEQMRENAVRAERARGGSRTGEELERELFDDAEDDRPDLLADQLRWLREAGFEEVEVHFKWAEAATFGAVKPGEEGA